MKLANFAYILGATAALAGYASWVQSQRPRAADGPASNSVPTTTIPLVRPAEAEALWRDPSTLFVDVRSEADYAYGHVPGAVLLPEEELEERLPALRARLERARVLVVYCKSPDCGKSLWAGLRLWGRGLRHVRIFPAGWYGWLGRKLPVERTATR